MSSVFLLLCQEAEREDRVCGHFGTPSVVRMRCWPPHEARDTGLLPRLGELGEACAGQGGTQDQQLELGVEDGGVGRVGEGKGSTWWEHNWCKAVTEGLSLSPVDTTRYPRGHGQVTFPIRTSASSFDKQERWQDLPYRAV